MTFKQFLTISVLVAVALLQSACSQHSAPNQAYQSNEPAAKIIGGSAVEAADEIAKSTVSIWMISRGSLICTGTLIRENIVMTAAHCTVEDPRDLAIVFSHKIPKTQEDISNVPIRRVFSGVTTPLWPRLKKNQRGNWGDLALLRFQGTMPDGFKVAELLPESLAKYDLEQKITLAGYGYVDGPNKTHSDELRKVQVQFANTQFSETELLFDQRNKMGACHGDSGGPAYLDVNGKLYVIGVTSRGYNDAQDTCERFSVYTHVVPFAKWMELAINSLNSMTGPQEIPQPIL